MKKDSENKIQSPEQIADHLRVTYVPTYLLAAAAVIAHRLSTIQQCNRIIVLKDGRVADEGNFEELQARGYFPDTNN